MDAQRTARALWVWLALFVAPVAGQALVAFAGVPWLPPAHHPRGGDR